ncbi:hypothetical protein [Streptomyces sp. NPDC088182]|uniref:hypothetical protein n=1 Tax=Streptomyces sp. NPDC088182 TaxID=3365838 RepID=UPI0038295B4F
MNQASPNNPVSAYTTIYQALTGSRPMPAAEAARLLSELRTETCADLAGGLRALGASEFQPRATDSRAIQRRKKAKYGAVIICADWVVSATGAQRTGAPGRRRQSMAEPPTPVERKISAAGGAS